MRGPDLPAVRAPLWALALFTGFFCAASVWMGADASWDLRNYHLYDAYAFLHGTLWRDIAPAQLQSFYPPVMDAAWFLLRRGLNAHPAVLAMMLALPHALAAWLALRIALYCGLPVGVGVLAVLLGAGGAAGLPTIGSAMSEAVPECLVLAALSILCRPPRHTPRRPVTGFSAGLLQGAALGLKLTFAPYAAGIVAAVLATGRWRSFASLATGIAAGALFFGGPWWWTLWQHTGNPLFPYFNNVFGSTWAPMGAMTDTRFLPSDTIHAVLFPFFWAVRPSRLIAELPVRDPRLALAWLGWIVVAARAWGRRQALPTPVQVVLVFWTVGFVAWEARFSILRYAATLELLAGIPIALALAPIRARVLAPIVAAIAAFTIYPSWGRASGPAAMDVRPPAFPAGTLVLLLDSAPMAYVAAFVPSSVLFAGVNSNLLRPGGNTALARAAAEAMAHDGPLWGLESPAGQPGEADRALLAYGLARAAPCQRVRSNLDADAILACPLRRDHSPRARRLSVSSPPSATLIATPASASSTNAANMRGISSR